LATRDDFPVSALAEAYDLGPWESIDMLPGGESDHYRLIAGSGEYAIRRSHRSKTSADMRFEHELVAHLRDSGFPAPVVVPTVSGDTCAAVDGDLYSVSVFVDGSGYEAGNAEHLRESARPCRVSPDLCVLPTLVVEIPGAVSERDPSRTAHGDASS
jgi:Ser/Thr protein kinase RdoA (MazF antagonist)